MIATDVSRYLAAEGHGVETGPDPTLMVSQLPDDPDNCAAVFDETAAQPDYTSDLTFDLWGFQVITRDASYASALSRAVAIHKQLAGFRSGQLAGAGPVVSFIGVVTPPASIGRDSRKRSQVSAHYVAHATSTGDAHRQ